MWQGEKCSKHGPFLSWLKLCQTFLSCINESSAHSPLPVHTLPACRFAALLATTRDKLPRTPCSAAGSLCEAVQL